MTIQLEAYTFFNVPYPCLLKQGWIFKSFSNATATTDASAIASAANKIWIFKSFSRNALGKTRGSLALLNDC